jgi:hypothetical protein
VIAADIVHLPPAHHCRPTQTMVLRVLPSADAKVAAVTWYVRPRHRRVTGPALFFPIVIRHLPRGAYTLKVVVTMANGNKLSEQRRYRTCATT